MFKNFKNFVFILSIVVLIGASSSIGYYFGTQHSKIIIIKGVDNIQNNQINNVDFASYWQVWDLIKKSYLRADKLKDQDLVYGSISGLVRSLNDPYSAFLKPDNAKRFKEDIDGVLSGIGAEIGVRGDFVVVISPLKNSPAEKAGLKAGDKILEVDSTSTANLGLDEIVQLIRGPKNTEVKLTILSNGDAKPKQIKIIRDNVNVPTVDWEMKDEKIAHVKLYNFNANAPRLLANSLNQALQAGAQGLILDLRNNPGGILEVAVTIAGIFVDQNKDVVSEEFASGQREVFTAHGDPVLKNFPTVILINKGSASASEILTGALKHYNKFPIVGEQSFGKGTVQELKNLSDKSTLKITVAHWVLPDGTIIEGNGIKPDYEIKRTEKDIENKLDPQLDKALEILRLKLSQ